MLVLLSHVNLYTNINMLQYFQYLALHHPFQKIKFGNEFWREFHAKKWQVEIEILKIL